MKKCQWTYGEDDCGQDGYFCSECGHFVERNYSDGINFIEAYHYCPNCGADMREEGDEE